MMLNLMDLRKDIEERYGVVTHLDEYIGNDAISFQTDGYKFIVYIKPKEFYGSDVYHYSIKVFGKYIKSVNVQGRLF